MAPVAGAGAEPPTVAAGGCPRGRNGRRCAASLGRWAADRRSRSRRRGCQCALTEGLAARLGLHEAEVDDRNGDVHEHEDQAEQRGYSDGGSAPSVTTDFRGGTTSVGRPFAPVCLLLGAAISFGPEVYFLLSAPSGEEELLLELPVTVTASLAFFSPYLGLAFLGRGARPRVAFGALALLVVVSGVFYAVAGSDAQGGLFAFYTLPLQWLVAGLTVASRQPRASTGGDRSSLELDERLRDSTADNIDSVRQGGGQLGRDVTAAPRIDDAGRPNDDGRRRRRARAQGLRRAQARR